MAGNFLRNMLHVVNIPWTVSRYELALYFSQFGHVHETYVAFDKQTGLHKGYGHVVFMKKDSMDTVLNRDHFLEGKNLVLSVKKHGDIDQNNDIFN